jgi:hypothetical protein
MLVLQSFDDCIAIITIADDEYNSVLMVMMMMQVASVLSIGNHDAPSRLKLIPTLIATKRLRGVALAHSPPIYFITRRFYSPSCNTATPQHGHHQLTE